ncbi:MAG: hypothetical protein JST00_29535 [Deltaproteobacteria bacterium]|nr:hypothetical protein [Deltaproteobacteria bacterium]
MPCQSPPSRSHSPLRPSRWSVHATRLLAATFVVATSACSDDASTSPGADSGTTPPTSTAPDAITDAVLAACPQSTTLITSSEWPLCLAGRRVTGTEPFNNTPCELAIGQNGAMEYRRGGAVALRLPDRGGWGRTDGTYQNDGSAGRRIFLASVTPTLPVVEGQPRLLRVTVKFFVGADDNVEVEYLDAARARQTYNCQVNVL